MITILSFLIYFAFTSHAYAYIDPNAGGFFFQTIAPIIYGILGVIVVFWKRISGFVKSLINRLTGQDKPKKDA